MMNRLRLMTFLLFVAIIMAGCTEAGQESEKSDDNKANAAENSEEAKEMNLIGNISLSKSSGRIGDEVTLTVDSLKPDKPLKA